MKMNKTQKKSLTALLSFFLAAQGWAATAASLGAGSRLWLEGSSTLHPFESEATVLDVALTTDEALAGALKASVPAALTVKVPVAGLKSKHKGLDKNLRKALKADEFPEIVFQMKGYSVEEGVIVAWGDLTVAGATKETTLNARVSWKDGRARLDGEQPILMSEFGIKPPSMMLGAVKTADKIVVKYHLEFETQNKEQGESHEKR
jgi:polyisoprenoid-binding protein YceI